MRSLFLRGDGNAKWLQELGVSRRLEPPTP